MKRDPDLRLALALFAGAGVATFILAAYIALDSGIPGRGMIETMFIDILLGEAALGMPAYYLARRRGLMRWWVAMGWGAILSLLAKVFLLVFLPSLAPTLGRNASALFLLAFWPIALMPLMVTAPAFAFGGLAFWLVARTMKPSRREPSA